VLFFTWEITNSYLITKDNNNAGLLNEFSLVTTPIEHANDLNINNLSAIDKTFPKFMKRWHIKGGAVAITKNGKLIYSRGFGHADAEQDIPVTPNHMFRIASVSKLITAVAIIKLAEQGKLNLDENVFGADGILNDSIYSQIRDERVKDITVFHLLNHSAGWRTYLGDPMFMPNTIARTMGVEAPPGIETIIQYVIENRNLDFSPGKQSFYSNFGYCVLGEVIEKVSGHEYKEYVTKQIFKPLGIENIRPGKNLLKDKYENEVKYYTHNNGKSMSYYSKKVYLPKPYGGNDIETLLPAGGWIASATGLMKLVVAIDGFDNKPDILSSKTIDLMTLSDQKTDPFGWKGTNDKDIWWRTGTLSGTSALLVRMPNQINWVVLFNTSTWKGDNFAGVVYRKMNRIIHNINDWPDHDLFLYDHPDYFLTKSNRKYKRSVY
jgi:CubicO group peptidase (beta-lactamase class C family)